MRGRKGIGQISPAEWVRIQSRYLAGDPVANIARDYGCTERLIHAALKEKAERAESAAEGRLAAQRGVFSDAELRAAYRLDAALRGRVAETMIAFLARFDHLLKGNTQENMRNLHNATEHLLRAAARVRLAIEMAARKHGQ